MKQREGLRKLTEEQKKRIKEAIKTTITEVANNGGGIDEWLPQAIITAIEEYHKIFNER